MSTQHGEPSIETAYRLVPSRRAAILDLLRQYHSLTVGALSGHLGVSETTIRRDLDRMQDEGALQRTHGGAVISTASTVFRMPETIPHLESKQRIARKVIELLEPGETVSLDAGTTTAAVATELRHFGPITVFTNDLHIAYELSDCESIELNVSGGTIRSRFYSLLGPLALSTIDTIHTHTAVLGLSAISVETGVTDSSLEAAQIKQAMIRSSERVILVADSSKVGLTLLAAVASLEQIDVFVTDDEVPAEFVRALRKASVEVVMA